MSIKSQTLLKRGQKRPNRFFKGQKKSKFICGQGLKNVNFPGIEISRGPQVEDHRPLMTSQKESVFFKALYSKILTITAFTWISLD